MIDTSTADTTKGVIDIILQHGITGAMLIIVLVGYFKKDAALEAERNARLADEKAHGDTVERQTATLATLQEKTNTLVSKLLEFFSRWEQRERDREVAERTAEQYQPKKPGLR